MTPAFLKDTDVIYRYLTEKYEQPKLTWAQENLLTLIDSVNDALVSTLLLQRSNIDTMQEGLFFNLQRERVEMVFKTLDEEVGKGMFNQWHYPAICLWCLLDWTEFRALAQWQQYPKLSQFYNKHASLTVLAETDPR